MIEIWPYLVAFKATGPKISFYNPLDIFWSKVLHICVNNPTKFPDRSHKLFVFRGTLVLERPKHFLFSQLAANIAEQIF